MLICNDKIPLLLPLSGLMRYSKGWPPIAYKNQTQNKPLDCQINLHGLGQWKMYKSSFASKLQRNLCHSKDSGTGISEILLPINVKHTLSYICE